VDRRFLDKQSMLELRNPKALPTVREDRWANLAEKLRIVKPDPMPG